MLASGRKAGLNSKSGETPMKKIFLTFALALGVLAMATEIRSSQKNAPVIVATPDAPPPDCWPNCGPLE
jgi:hypothetical protein